MKCPVRGEEKEILEEVKDDEMRQHLNEGR